LVHSGVESAVNAFGFAEGDMEVETGHGLGFKVYGLEGQKLNS
jgi:hypothetical protein